MAIKIKDELENNAVGNGKVMGGVLNSDGTGATKVETSNNAYDLYNKPTDDSNAGATTNDIYQDEISKAAKEKNYNNFYNTAMQMYNYEQNSKKYMNNALANMGLKTQGYGSSMNAGISNQAMNLYNQNLSALNQSNTEADLAALERKNAADTESDEQLITFLSNATSEDDVNNFLINYGYMDKDGNQLKEMNPYVKSVYDQVINNVVNKEGEQIAGEYTSINDFGKSKWGVGRTQSISTRFSAGWKDMTSAIDHGDIKSGDIICLSNRWGEDVYITYTKDGVWKYVTEEDFDKSSSKHYYGYYAGKQRKDKVLENIK